MPTRLLFILALVILALPLAPLPVIAADRTATIIHGGNLRREPRIAPQTVIGQVCPGDRMSITRTSVVGQTTWAYGTLTALAAACDPARVPKGTVGWLSMTLLKLDTASTAPTATPVAPVASTVPAATPVAPVATPVASTSEQLALGNPSGATADPGQPNNYLIVRDQYALSYSRDRGIPTWVSWHLAAADLGTTTRDSGAFITDNTLPAGWYRVTHNDYANSGYDRGHMTPSGDRTASEEANEATFILTNVLPQAPASNQGPWEKLESSARDLVTQSNELYLLAGGTGSQSTLAGGKLSDPAATWKLIVVLPAATGNDVARITAQTTLIAVWMPNSAAVRDQLWTTYTTTVRCLEERTGLQFLTAVPASVRTALLGAGCGAAEPTPIKPTAPPVPTTTPVPSAVATPAQITIPYIVYNPPGDDLVGEYVPLRNGGGSPATLTGWTLRDAANHVYTYPAFTLAAGAEVRLWTKAGRNDASNLYWGQKQAVWNNEGDTAILRDAKGREVARFHY